MRTFTWCYTFLYGLRIRNFEYDFVLKGLQEPILGPAAGQPSLWRHLHMRCGQHRRRRWQQRRPLANRRFTHLSDTILLAQRRPSADPYCEAHTGGWPLANRRRRRKGGGRWIRLPGQLQLSHQDSPGSGGARARRAALFRGFQASSRETVPLRSSYCCNCGVLSTMIVQFVIVLSMWKSSSGM